jgi:hypothetical protein
MYKNPRRKTSNIDAGLDGPGKSNSINPINHEDATCSILFNQPDIKLMQSMCKEIRQQFPFWLNG